MWQTRIGKLLPGGEDKWWLVANEDDAVAAADELVAAVLAYVLPAMQAHLTA